MKSQGIIRTLFACCTVNLDHFSTNTFYIQTTCLILVQWAILSVIADETYRYTMLLTEQMETVALHSELMSYNTWRDQCLKLLSRRFPFPPSTESDLSDVACTRPSLTVGSAWTTWASQFRVNMYVFVHAECMCLFQVLEWLCMNNWWLSGVAVEIHYPPPLWFTVAWRMFPPLRQIASWSGMEAGVLVKEKWPGKSSEPADPFFWVKWWRLALQTDGKRERCENKGNSVVPDMLHVLT